MELQYKHVLVAVDGSDASNQAFEKAIEICKRYQSELTIAHVIDIKSYSGLNSYQFNFIENVEEYGKKILAEYKDKAQKAGIEDVTTRLDNGSPKIKIPKNIAPEIGADLIICGATGHNAVERFFIGSVSENITRYAKVDVLVVRC